MLGVVPVVANDTGTVGPIGELISFVCQCCVSQGWVLRGHVVLAHRDMYWVRFSGVTPWDLAIPYLS